MERSFGTEISGNRRPKAELSTEQRSAILAKLDIGQSPTKLATEFNCARSTIYDTKKRFQNHHQVESLPRSGRPRLTSDRTRRLVYQLARRNPTWSYLTLRSQLPVSISRSSIIKILKPYGLNKRRVRRKIPLTPLVASIRRRFALKWHRFRTWDQWIFSDECSIQRHSKSTGSGGA